MTIDLKILYVLWLILLLCVYHTCKSYICIIIIMQIKQFSNIEEYVKYVLQIVVHIKFNQ
jgi:hypothetical protein